MPKLESQQRIISFLSEEFFKIKTQRQCNKRLRLKVTEKLIRKLFNDIELILKTSSFENNVNLKIIDLRSRISRPHY